MRDWGCVLTVDRERCCEEVEMPKIGEVPDECDERTPRDRNRAEGQRGKSKLERREKVEALMGGRLDIQVAEGEGLELAK